MPDDTDTRDDGLPPVESVALYLVDRAYGGPEEGGWWYDYGTLVPLEQARELAPMHWQPQYLTREENNTPRHQELRDHVLQGQAYLDATANKGRPSTSSVLSQGRYELCWVDGHPHDWPEEAPHYE